MIVPSNRLLWWIGLTVLPASAIGGLVPGAGPWAIGVVAIALACALIDALAAPRRLQGVRLELPELVRMSRSREAAIPFTIHCESGASLLLRAGLPLPAEFESKDDTVWTRTPEGAKASRMEWLCTGSRRGSYRVERAYFETGSPMEFWRVRGWSAVNCEIRVYPDLRMDSRGVTALFLNRGGVGMHAIRQVGRGRDFEKLREYESGDTYDEIHWKTTAKRGKPVTKVFQMEKTQEVYAIVDGSRLTGRDSGFKGENVLERFVNAALLLMTAAERQGDLCGLATFSDRVHQFVRARNGKSHFNTCREAIYTMHPRLVSPDFDEVATFLRLKLRRRAMLVVLTALDDPVLSESFVKAASLLARQHLVVVGIVAPPDARAMFEGPEVQEPDDVYRALGGHFTWRRLKELESTLGHHGIRLVMLDSANMAAQVSSMYLNAKMRQLL